MFPRFQVEKIFIRDQLPNYGRPLHVSEKLPISLRGKNLVLEHSFFILPNFSRPTDNKRSAPGFGQRYFAAFNPELEVCKIFFGAHDKFTCPDSRRGSSRSRVRRRVWI